jgi:hypothetical protein
MVKNVLQKAGRKTALVVLGWVSFILGQIIACPWIAIPLNAIARVLP